MGCTRVAIPRGIFSPRSQRQNDRRWTAVVGFDYFNLSCSVAGRWYFSKISVLNTVHFPPFRHYVDDDIYSKNTGDVYVDVKNVLLPYTRRNLIRVFSETNATLVRVSFARRKLFIIYHRSVKQNLFFFLNHILFFSRVKVECLSVHFSRTVSKKKKKTL